MSILRRLATAICLLPLLAVTTWAQDYKVRTGDVLQIEVLEDGTLNRTAIVLPDGQISLPLAGSVRAGQAAALPKCRPISQAAWPRTSPPPRPSM